MSSSYWWAKKCTDVPQFDALATAAASFRSDEKLHLRNLCNDSSRCAGLTALHLSDNGKRKIMLDYSRQQVTGETMELLFDLADAVGFTDKRTAMRTGHKINLTEDRAVMHHMLRMPASLLSFNKNNNNNAAAFSPINAGSRSHSNGGTPTSGATTATSILQQVHAVRNQINDFTAKVRSGEIVGVTGKSFQNVVCIGIGGSYLGPQCVMEALRADPDASKAAKGLTLRFLANVDPVDFALCTRDLDPAQTLVIVISKTFGTPETMLNARTARKWLVDELSSPDTDTNDNNITPIDIVAQHMVAVSSNTFKCTDFGISEANVFAFWDWVGGRYSVCSAVGLLPLSLLYSYEVMSSFLDGAHDVDQHFFKTPLRDNIPVILGLLGVWNSTFLGYGVRALLPYSQALWRFPAHIQQVDMESNGKRVALDGVPLLHASGEITFGQAGTCGQHSFYQLLHQGRVVPADFIGFMESQTPIEMPNEPVSNHDELMSNFFAQPDALAYGKTLTDLVQEGVPEELREHMVFTGNRPSSSILMTKLDAFAIGQLLALYEHRTAVQGFIWGINSFDQWGVELGKVLAKQVRAQLSASRKTGASVQGFNSSTSSLLEVYLDQRKKFVRKESM